MEENSAKVVGLVGKLGDAAEPRWFFMIRAQSSHFSEVIRQNAAHSAEKLQDNEKKRIFLTFL